MDRIQVWGFTSPKDPKRIGRAPAEVETVTATSTCHTTETVSSAPPTPSVWSSWLLQYMCEMRLVFNWRPWNWSVLSNDDPCCVAEGRIEGWFVYLVGCTPCRLSFCFNSWRMTAVLAFCVNTNIYLRRYHGVTSHLFLLGIVLCILIGSFLPF